MSESQYEIQAREVAKKIGIAIEVVPSREQMAPPWDGNGIRPPHGIRYLVTVKRSYNSGQAFVFDFWSSPDEKENHEAPSIRSVLVFLRTRATGSTDLAAQIRKFFTLDELLLLAEVQ